MNTIMGLLKKDLYNLSNYKTSLIISTLVCGLAVIGTGSAELGPILICTILGMIALSTFNYSVIFHQFCCFHVKYNFTIIDKYNIIWNML